MAVRKLLRGMLPIALLIATGGKVRARLRRRATASLPADFTARVDGLFAKWNRRDSPGCAVGIVHRGQVIYSKGFGSANLEYRVPNTPQTVFEVASFSKSLTCVCLALLMDEGKISPDDDLRKFVPEMHPFDPPIRIRDLVRCRSGLWDQVALPILVGWENRALQHPHTEADFLSLLAGQKTLPFPPGSQYRIQQRRLFPAGAHRETGQRAIPGRVRPGARLRAARHESHLLRRRPEHASSSSARSAITNASAMPGTCGDPRRTGQAEAD